MKLATRHAGDTLVTGAYLPEVATPEETESVRRFLGFVYWAAALGAESPDTVVNANYITERRNAVLKNLGRIGMHPVLDMDHPLLAGIRQGLDSLVTLQYEVQRDDGSIDRVGVSAIVGFGGAVEVSVKDGDEQTPFARFGMNHGPGLVQRTAFLTRIEEDPLGDTFPDIAASFDRNMPAFDTPITIKVSQFPESPDAMTTSY